MNNFVAKAFIWLLHVSICFATISEEKCNEYSKLEREKRDYGDDLLEAFINFRPPGKEPTKIGEFPHMVQLGYGDKDKVFWACGGSLISDEYVLTSATCETIEVLSLYQDNRRRRQFVFIKELLNGTLPELPPPHTPIQWIKIGNELVQIEKIIIHPDFKREKSPITSLNDIALVKLATKVNFTKTVQPACLFQKVDDLNNKTVIATGWGALRLGQIFSTDLMKVELKIMNKTECNNIYNTLLGEDQFSDNPIQESQFCAEGRNELKDLCFGDGGAPFQMKNEKYSSMYDIVGILSYGYTCNFYDVPIIATKVYNYIPWIENIVWSA